MEFDPDLGLTGGLTAQPRELDDPREFATLSGLNRELAALAADEVLAPIFAPAPGRSVCPPPPPPPPPITFVSAEVAQATLTMDPGRTELSWIRRPRACPEEPATTAPTLRILTYFDADVVVNGSIQNFFDIDVRHLAIALDVEPHVCGENLAEPCRSSGRRVFDDYLAILPGGRPAAPDYATSARLLAPLADYLVVNVSSPNTPGLRNLQAVEKLEPILRAVMDASRQSCEAAKTKAPPLLVKIAPDLADEDVDAAAQLAVTLDLAGVVATNTTIGRSGLRTDAAKVTAIGAGGLSGAPLKRRATEVVRRVRQKLGPTKSIIGVGGIETGDDAWERLSAGANLIQLYTGFIYGGPTTPRDVARSLSERMKREGKTKLPPA